MTLHSAQIFAIPTGANFATHFLQGLEERYHNSKYPEDFARLEVIVNTQRLKKVLVQKLSQSRNGFIPKIKVLSNLLTDPEWALPAYINAPTINIFTFIEYVRTLSKADDTKLPACSVSAFSHSLAALHEEIESEYVDFSVINTLKSDKFSEHWRRNLDFLRLIDKFAKDQQKGTLPFKTRYGILRAIIEAKITKWQNYAPTHPIIIAGSTGSRAPTARLMHAVAQLKNGAVVLPALDYDYPWPDMDDETSQVNFDKNPILPVDHAQARLARFIYQNGKTPAKIKQWVKVNPLYKKRQALISLAMRPAPVTDQWREVGVKLGDMRTLTEGLSLLYAADEKTEATAIAICLREAAQTGKAASVITPDRILGRKIAAELKRWNIVADESAGMPLSQTATGRFVIEMVDLIYKDPLPTLSEILIFLKTPLIAAAQKDKRISYLRAIRAFEFWARKEGKKKVSFQKAFVQWVETAHHDIDETWLKWFSELLHPAKDGDFFARMRDLISRLEKAYDGHISAKMFSSADCIWYGQEGLMVKQNLEKLCETAPAGMQVSAYEFKDILKHTLNSANLRIITPTHPNIAIWGTLEARAQRNDITIIAGLNERIWPGTEQPDHWLNRTMRKKIGLITPDNKIGLMAHDFQSAISDGEVILSRALRDGDGESVASRWLLRLENLLHGLEEQKGKEALENMHARGAKWLEMAKYIDNPVTKMPRATRPSPCPPKETRPKRYAPTSIEHLIRDPYHIYAKYILKITRLDDIYAPLDERHKGQFFHKILKNFGNILRENTNKKITEKYLHETFKMTTQEAFNMAEIDDFTRLSWQSEISQWEKWFLADEYERQKTAHIKGLEITARDDFDALDIAVNARADRIDINAENKALIYDYKTGKIPTRPQIELFSKQLLIEAALLERGAFKEIGELKIKQIEYIELSKNHSKLIINENKIDTLQIWADIESLLNAYNNSIQGFSARRALMKSKTPSDYDLLSRFGEWDMNHKPQKIKVGTYHG